MRKLGRYWVALLAVLLLCCAAGVYVCFYLPARRQFERAQTDFGHQISGLQASIAQNGKYKDMETEIAAAREAIAGSRRRLYAQFPAALREEDQLLYLRALETQFGIVITRSNALEDSTAVLRFGAQTPVAVLSDGAIVNGLDLRFNFTATYQGFQEMVDRLANDGAPTSVCDANIRYDVATDTVSGIMTIRRYLLDSPLVEYAPPDIRAPAETGKPNLFADRGTH